MVIKKNDKRIAWVTVPAFISTDRFIIQELSKHYNIDWYLVTKKNEEIDFLKFINEMANGKRIKLEIIEISYRNSDPRIVGVYSKFLMELKNKKYDLIYNVMIGIPYFMPLLRVILGKKHTLVAIHNVHVPKGGTQYFPSKLYTSFTIKAFDYFQTFSKAQKKELLSIAPKKYCDNVSFMLMDYGEPTIVKKSKKITFLSFGYIRDYKRIDVLINAAQKAFERTGISFKVIIAGSCDDWEKYEKLVTLPELFDLRIQRINDDDVPNLFAESDYFVATYQDIAQSGAAIIAVNYNKPVIASKLEAFENYVEEEKTGFLIKPADCEELTEKIIYILNNHQSIYSKLQENIHRIKIERFSPDGIARLYMKNFDKIINDCL
ncbi:MAG: glycosyltransferase family 4 protein [Velocimicrobium sp.]